VTARLLLDIRDELQPVEVQTRVTAARSYQNCYRGHIWANTVYTMPYKATAAGREAAGMLGRSAAATAAQDRAHQRTRNLELLSAWRKFLTHFIQTAAEVCGPPVCFDGPDSRRPAAPAQHGLYAALQIELLCNLIPG
jgi:hypothetical protein